MEIHFVPLRAAANGYFRHSLICCVWAKNVWNYYRAKSEIVPFVQS